MLCERIYLDENDSEVYLDTYVADNKNAVRDAMLVIPGGGYSQVCSLREGEPIALAYQARGYNTFVLNYRVGFKEYPAQLIDASRAVLHIRKNAEKYNIDPERIFAVGFSAGGHLAGSLAVLHSDPEVLSALGIKEGENRPRGVVLAYPVVSAVLPTHEGSFVHLTGGTPFAEIPEELKKKLSLELHVSENTSPAFIWHTAEDKLVPINGSLALMQAYVDKGINVMGALYPYGPHGVALANPMSLGSLETVQPIAEKWVDSSVEWMKTL